MENHVLCYVKRKNITDWKRLVITHDEPAFIFGSKDDYIFANQLADGGTLWIVSPIQDRSPELVARLSVITVLKIDDPKLETLGVSRRLLQHFSKWKWIAVGDSDSEFFGHNTAGNALLQTVFESTSGDQWILSKESDEWQGRYGMRLQRPTKISNLGLGSCENGVAALKELASTSKRSVFISWKWHDNSKHLIRSLAYALAENGIMPWLDLLALPKSRALLKVRGQSEKLESLLSYGYRRCSAVIGVTTANYCTQSKGSDKNWTRREWEGDLAPNKPLAKIIYYPYRETKLDMIQGADLLLSSSQPFVAAKELRDFLDSRSESNQLEHT